ncbi:MAG: hypothetical protein JSR58_00500 [Verrucomicrobia bacterium]|nr:hypothetical protein [Verrucomicrobiota bacterium]
MKYIFLCCFSAQLMALSCSNVTTLSTPGQLCHAPRVAMNDQGDAVAMWKIDDDVSDDEYLYTAVRKKNVSWGPSSVLAKNNEWIKAKFFKIDPSSHIQAALELEQEEDDERFQFVEKKWGEVVPSVTAYIKPTFEIGRWPTFNEEGKLFCLGHIAGKMVIASALSGQKPVYTNLASVERYSTYDETIAFDPHHRAVAVWQESVYGKDYKYSYVIKLARENDDGSWTVPETVTTIPRLAFGVKVHVNAQGNVALLWSHDDGLYVTSQEMGKWSKPVFLGEKRVYAFRLVSDKEGNLLVTWEDEKEKKEVIFAAYKPVGQSWQPSIQITPSHLNCDSHEVTYDGRENFVIVWHQAPSKKEKAIYGAAFSTKQEKWSTPTQLSPKGQNCKSPHLTFSSKGDGVLGWVYLDTCCNRSVQVADLKVD